MVVITGEFVVLLLFVVIIMSTQQLYLIITFSLFFPFFSRSLFFPPYIITAVAEAWRRVRAWAWWCVRHCKFGTAERGLGRGETRTDGRGAKRRTAGRVTTPTKRRLFTEASWEGGAGAVHPLTVPSLPSLYLPPLPSSHPPSQYPNSLHPRYLSLLYLPFVFYLFLCFTDFFSMITSKYFQLQLPSLSFLSDNLLLLCFFFLNIQCNLQYFPSKHTINERLSSRYIFILPWIYLS